MKFWRDLHTRTKLYDLWELASYPRAWPSWSSTYSYGILNLNKITFPKNFEKRVRFNSRTNLRLRFRSRITYSLATINYQMIFAFLIRTFAKATDVVAIEFAFCQLLRCMRLVYASESSDTIARI